MGLSKITLSGTASGVQTRNVEGRQKTRFKLAIDKWTTATVILTGDTPVSDGDTVVLSGNITYSKKGAYISAWDTQAECIPNAATPRQQVSSDPDW